MPDAPNPIVHPIPVRPFLLRLKIPIAVLALAASLTIAGASTLVQAAGKMTSVYTKLNLETDCRFHQRDEQGGRAKCSGFGDYAVHFAEGDLRQMVEFGFIGENDRGWVSFSQWNRIGQTVEWRLWDGRPLATILRWYIENVAPDTGSADKRLEGQVLVVSKVGQPDARQACVVGYVDARANRGANTIAREVADTVVPRFRCGTDVAKYYGKRGPTSGTP
jgi:hypothetical protein